MHGGDSIWNASVVPRYSVESDNGSAQGCALEPYERAWIGDSIMKRGIGIAGCLMIAFGASLAFAGIPEPDVVLYGQVRIGGTPV